MINKLQAPIKYLVLNYSPLTFTFREKNVYILSICCEYIVHKNRKNARTMRKLWFLITLLLFLSHQLTANSLLSEKTSQPITVMLDPAGDAKHTGRVIDDNFERGITLQFTEQLKSLLELRNKNLRVILTRFPGETLEPLQNASFANRLNTNFYISVQFYQERSERSNLYLYHYLTKPTDAWQKHIEALHFYTYDKAHLPNVIKSKTLGTMIASTLKKKRYKTFFNYKGLFGIPFKPLAGITSSAIAIEVGLISKNDWENFILPLANAIEVLVQ